jgi:hypothetical protein
MCPKYVTFYFVEFGKGFVCHLIIFFGFLKPGVQAGGN